MSLLDKKYYFCIMIELAKHIEVLLLENDCVIVPGLGGFIAHNRQAEFKESENRFCSPARTIGFNPQLVMNDGLLVQTYMQAYNTDFPDATRKIEKIVSALKEQLYQKGEVCLPNVGTLYYTMNGTYVFEPSASNFFTPYLYGLDTLSLSPLQALAAEEEKDAVHPFVHKVKPNVRKGTFVSDSGIGYKRTFQRLVQHAIGVAAAILLFFLLSVPVENTYLDDASYASLSAESMFDAIRGRSAATQLLGSLDKEQDNTQRKGVQRTKNNVNTLRPVCVKCETVAPAAKLSAKETNTTPKDIAPLQEKVTDKAPNAAETTLKSTKEVKSTVIETPKMEKTAVKVESTKPEAKTTPLVTDKSSKGYYIIVASLATSADAQKQVKAFQRKGFAGASVLENNGHHRIALCHFSNPADAYKKLNELRKQEAYKRAWVFTVK